MNQAIHKTILETGSFALCGEPLTLNPQTDRYQPVVSLYTDEVTCEKCLSDIEALKKEHAHTSELRIYPLFNL